LTEVPGRARVFDFEAFGTSTGLAVVCGALSVVVPSLTAGTAALAALGLASWVSLARRRGVLAWNTLEIPTGVALAVLGASMVAYLVPPAPLALYRGLLLSFGLLPLVLVERRRRARVIPAFVGDR
jgi:hypothetical protein